MAELERRAEYFLGPYTDKEYEAAKSILSHEGCINQPFFEMGIATEPRSKPTKGAKRNQEPGNLGSEVPKQKKKKASASKGKTRKLEKIKQSVKMPKPAKKVHIYKAFESDEVYLDDQIDTQQALVMGFQLPPSYYLSPNDAGLPPSGQGS